MLDILFGRKFGGLKKNFRISEGMFRNFIRLRKIYLLNFKNLKTNFPKIKIEYVFFKNIAKYFFKKILH